MNFIRTLISIGGMIVVFALIAEFLVMPVYTRHNQNRIMMDVQNKMLDEVVRLLKSENYRYEVSDTLYTN